VATSLSASRSRYARMSATESGIDPYTRAISDVYQDLFAEGSFIGKGIYEVDVFERALADRLPQNRILSHDLLEGSYARSGLISDVELHDDYPARYAGDVGRRQRWIRGDWQLAGWLLPRVPVRGGASMRNPLSWLAQWKLFDNLRRSLVAPALVTLLALAFTALEPAAWWVAVAMVVMAFPAVMGSLQGLVAKSPDVDWRRHLVHAGQATAQRALQLAFTLACLPHEAAYSAAAILRTHWRMLVTRRHLLEWTASSEQERHDPG
jgi:hypothetical protein